MSLSSLRLLSMLLGMVLSASRGNCQQFPSSSGISALMFLNKTVIAGNADANLFILSDDLGKSRRISSPCDAAIVAILKPHYPHLIVVTSYSAFCFDSELKKATGSFHLEDDVFFDAAIDNAGNLLLAGSKIVSLRLSEQGALKFADSFRLESAATSIAWVAEGKALFSNKKGELQQIDIRANSTVKIADYGSTVGLLRVRPKQQQIIVGGSHKERRLAIYSVKGELIKAIPMRAHVATFDFLSERIVAAGLVDGGVSFVNIDTGKSETVSTKDEVFVSAVCCVPERKIVFAGTVRGRIEIVDVAGIEKKLE